MSRLSRRALLAVLPVASVARALSGPGKRSPPKGLRTRGPKVVVVGAGAFGGWTALYLLRRGAKVTLLDAWGPGNSRASSGGETRVIRATYGPNRVYVQMVARALRLWRENEERWGKRLYRRTGALWMAGKDDRFEKASLPLLREAGLAFEELTVGDAAKRYPQINFQRIEWSIVEKEGGYLTARRACEAVLEGFQSEGGEYRQVSASPAAIEGGKFPGLSLSDGTKLVGDAYVFACGPWLGKLFPEAMGNLIHPTRQEVFFFGTPAGDSRFSEETLPVWIDNGERLFYGIPGNQWRGFKVADDTRGAPFDPTSGERVASLEGLEKARDYLGFRFPALKGSPLLESRVCQYENSPDQHFIVDRHPDAGNVWLVGGGSGHGFKHGPAMGELVAGNVLGKKPTEPFFSLSRFKARA
ncbi:MAG TPA: FAD-dependent oxidoreductase [Thermoanaerobaculia bacterium]